MMTTLGIRITSFEDLIDADEVVHIAPFPEGIVMPEGGLDWMKEPLRLRTLCGKVAVEKGGWARWEGPLTPPETECIECKKIYEKRMADNEDSRQAEGTVGGNV